LAISIARPGVMQSIIVEEQNVVKLFTSWWSGSKNERKESKPERKKEKRKEGKERKKERDWR
jgi:hypothetical protein